MKKIICVNNVSKKYRANDNYSISNVSFDVEEGEIIGLLGPNGAGKSTLIKMILGVMRTTDGKIEVFGTDPIRFSNSQKRQLGVYLSGKSSLIYNLPVIESVKLFKSIYKVSKYDYDRNLAYYSRALKCETILNQRVSTLSLGQKLRAELLCILIYSPKVLILDEPTLGLDIEGKKQFREILRNLVRDTLLSVLITTHDVSDMEKICSRILMIKGGNMILDLSEKQFENILKKYTILNTDCEIALQNNESVKLIEYDGRIYRYLVTLETISNIKKIITQYDYSLLQQESPRLEDLFYEYYR